MNTIEKKLSQWRGRIKLKTVALWVMIPLCLLAGLCTLPILRFMGDLGDFSSSFRTRLIPQILNTQATFVNLESLNRSIAVLKYSTDNERARRAYIDSWSVVMESLYDRPKATQDLLYRMADDLNGLWEVRQSLDAIRSQVFTDWQSLYTSGVTLHALTHTDALEHDKATFLSYETTTHFSFHEKLRDSADAYYRDHRALCRGADSALVGTACQAMKATKLRLDEHFTGMQTLMQQLNQKIKHIDEHVIELTEKLSLLEINSSMSMVDDVSDLSLWVKHAIAFFSAVFAFMFVSLILLIAFVLWPLTRLSAIGRDFRVNMKRPDRLPTSIIYEIQEMIRLLPLLFADIEQKHEETSRLEEKNAQLANENMLDALTGVANRRILESIQVDGLKDETAVLMFDLDHFKRINDTKGHPFGDFVLCTVAKLLRNHLNRADVLCRYGGEEFCAVLNHVNAQEARSVAERLAALIRASHFMSPEGEETTLTMSIGVSSVWNATSRLTLDELIDQADRALYEAKASGRDRVCVYEA